MYRYWATPGALRKYLTVSLPKNIDKLEEFLDNFSRKIDVICISETRLNNAKLNNVIIPGYHLYYCNSKTMAGGSAISL